jgi:uncharacterized membrane protein YphA (DoxX/SURF4 family)
VAYLVGIVELFRGILIAIGLLTRVAAAAAAIEFAVIVFFIKLTNGFSTIGEGSNSSCFGVSSASPASRAAGDIRSIT